MFQEEREGEGKNERKNVSGREGGRREEGEKDGN